MKSSIFMFLSSSVKIWKSCSWFVFPSDEGFVCNLTCVLCVRCVVRSLLQYFSFSRTRKLRTQSRCSLIRRSRRPDLSRPARCWLLAGGRSGETLTFFLFFKTLRDIYTQVISVLSVSTLQFGKTVHHLLDMSITCVCANKCHCHPWITFDCH